QRASVTPQALLARARRITLAFPPGMLVQSGSEEGIVGAQDRCHKALPADTGLQRRAQLGERKSLSVAGVREKPIVHTGSKRKRGENPSDPCRITAASDRGRVESRRVELRQELGAFLVLRVREKLRLVVAHGHDDATARPRCVTLQGPD